MTLEIGVVTLFPELFEPFLQTSFLGRAIAGGQLSTQLENLREHGLGKHRAVDDTPYGGGAGMLLRVDCVVAAMDHLASRMSSPRRILLSPQGQPFTQATARRWANCSSLMFVCGRYEGFDDRVREFVDEEASLGDFVMVGGEVAAMAMMEACVRLLPGVLGNHDSAAEESFTFGLRAAQANKQAKAESEPTTTNLLEYPQYTRPVEFRGRGVPEVLKSGHHGDIASWRAEQARQRTRERRPDLLADSEGEA